MHSFFDHMYGSDIHACTCLHSLILPPAVCSQKLCFLMIAHTFIGTYSCTAHLTLATAALSPAARQHQLEHIQPTCP
jgi:hypothetical protein